MFSGAKPFSRIYVETAARNHPRAVAILERFPRSEVVEIEDYKNVFGRARQDFWKQKSSVNLILAMKKDNFLYPGNDLLQGNMLPNFFYNALVLNCPYDCHYCYLQGMYPGANIVAFVNLEDYFSAADDACRQRPCQDKPMHLAISYDTDLLGLEGKLGYVREWIEWSRDREEILMEVRTKSAHVRTFRETRASRAVRIAWTLSPDPVCRKYETGAPALMRRIDALNAVASAGWRIAICIDPVLKIPDASNVYAEFAEQLGKNLPWKSIERIEIGVFRVGTTFFKRMRKRPDTDLLHYPFEHDTSAVSYNRKERLELVKDVLEPLQNYTSREKIFLWT